MGTKQISKSTSGLRRIAIVLSSLPSEVAADLVNAVDPELKQDLEVVFATLDPIDDDERKRILQQFSDSVGSSESPEVHVTSRHGDIEDEFQRGDPTPAGLREDRLRRQVSSVVTQWDLPTTNTNTQSPFAFLDEIQDELVAKVLSDEHPQMIALVFASITPKQAARILPRLEAVTQAETLRRIESLDEVFQSTAEDVARHLKEKLESVDESLAQPGRNALEAIKQAMPHDFEEVFLPSRSRHPELPQDDHVIDAESILAEPPTQQPTDSIATVALATETDDTNKEVQFSNHDYLTALSPDDLCRGLGQVSTRTAFLALCGLPSEVADAAILRLPRSRANIVRREMRDLKEVRIGDIDNAMQAVAKTCLELADQSAPIAA